MKLLQNMVRSGWSFQPPGGESRKQVLRRSLAAIYEAHTSWPGESILVVCHEGVIKCLLYHLTKRKFLPDEPPLIKPNHLHLLEQDNKTLYLKEAELQPSVTALYDITPGRKRMNILIYCQHVVGIGHLCRMMEIIRALKNHDVTLILGGPPVDIAIPDNVDVIQLPGLMMDAKYTRMFPVDPGQSLEETKQKRKTILLDLVAREPAGCTACRTLSLWQRRISF